MWTRRLVSWGMASLIALKAPEVMAATDTIQGRAEVLEGLFYVFTIFAGGLVLYLVPTIVAYSRRHNNATAILILNLLLGWTLLGWIGALVWSLTKDVGKERYRGIPGPGSPRQAPTMSTPPVTTVAAAGVPGVADELRKLIELKEAGVLSEEEFSRQRAKLLA